MICHDQLKSILIEMGVRPDRATKYAPSIAKTFDRYGIDTPLRMGHALAQMLHESAMLSATRENLNYSAKGLRRVFRKYFTWAQAVRYARKPEAIANRVYANRGGNGSEASGDGWKFRGGGTIQLTLKDNYVRYTDYVRRAFGEAVDFVKNPELVADAPYAVDVFGYFWKIGNGTDLSRWADKGDTRSVVTRITRRINGGTNGLEDRVNLFCKAMLHLRKVDGYTSDTAKIA